MTNDTVPRTMHVRPQARTVPAVPEGHTIHRIAQDHTKLLAGRALSVSSPQGRFASDAERVDGAVLERIEAYGKHLFHHWSTGDIGHVHLGLFGRFRVQRLAPGADVPEPRGQVRMRLATDSVVVDLSGPTACSIGTPEDRAAILARLGPDPLRRDAKPAVAIAAMTRRKAALGTLLLDQSVLCGVGNVYRAEALFVNGIHPERPGSSCDEVELRALWDTIVGMLRQGVRDNRIVTVEDADLPPRPPGRRRRRGETTYVYHRDLCLRCGTPIQIVTLAARACWFCPTCQPH
jgi:endonuclease-8